MGLKNNVGLRTYKIGLITELDLTNNVGLITYKVGLITKVGPQKQCRADNLQSWSNNRCGALPQARGIASC